MKPNSRKIAEVYLAAKGFTNSKVTTHAAHSTGTAEWKTRDPAADIHQPEIGFLVLGVLVIKSTLLVYTEKYNLGTNNLQLICFVFIWESDYVMENTFSYIDCLQKENK